MIYAAPGATVETVSDGFATGLTGTVGYRLRDNQGADTIARTTAGITEDIAGSGIYRAQFVAPAVAGQFTIVWDDGTGSYATEDLVVTYTAVTGGAPPPASSGGGYVGATELTLILPAGVSIGTNTSPINLGEVATMLAEVSARIDVTAAGKGYDVPISTTATIAYAAVQEAVKQGAGARILNTLFPNMGGPGGKTTLAGEYKAAYDAFLKGVKDGSVALPGATRTSTGGRQLPRSRSSAGEPTGYSASPFFPIDWQP
ncbi:MAG TPA: hypothetical protein VIL92_06265 [Gaiellaceae bacterium]